MRRSSPGHGVPLLFQVPPSVLILYLGFFAGFLLYIGASDTCPRPTPRPVRARDQALIGITCLGAAFMFSRARATGNYRVSARSSCPAAATAGDRRRADLLRFSTVSSASRRCIQRNGIRAPVEAMRAG